MSISKFISNISLISDELLEKIGEAVQKEKAKRIGLSLLENIGEISDEELKALSKSIQREEGERKEPIKVECKECKVLYDDGELHGCECGTLICANCTFPERGVYHEHCPVKIIKS